MSLVLVALLHVAVIYAIANGLAHQMIELLPQNVKVAIIPPTQEKVTPPPPPPQFKQPPPYVPPPDVTIDLTQAAPATNAITAQSTANLTAPASVGARHYCDPNKYYSEQAKNNNWSGTTVLTFHIGTDGSVKNLQVRQSSGHPELDEAAMRCASSWRYNPAKQQNGQPTEVPWSTNVKWNLKG